jgi:hypothetical protein
MTAHGHLAAVNLSLGANPYVRYVPHHPVNMASKALAEFVPVTVAVGNGGDKVDEVTSSPWSRAPWVVSVGATETIEGDAVAEYSSGGIADDSSTWPTVVAYGASSLDSRHIGTSYAAPRAARQIMYLAAFILTLSALIENLKTGFEHGVPPIFFGNIDRGIKISPRRLPLAALPFFAIDVEVLRYAMDIVRKNGRQPKLTPSPILLVNMLLESAQPVPGASRYRAGGGFVSDSNSEAYLSRFSAYDLVRCCVGRTLSLAGKERSSLQSALLTDTRNIGLFLEVWRSSSVPVGFDIDAYADPVHPNDRISQELLDRL